MDPPRTLTAVLDSLLEAHHSFNPSQPTYSDGAPTPLQFLQIIRKNHPHIFRRACADFRARQKWSIAYLSEKLGEVELEVAETPLGNADSVVSHDGEDVFVKPYTRRMPGKDLLQAVREKTGTVKYAQSQNSNLHDEFTPLAPDLPPSIPWADEALGQQPDAVNVWIGNSRSVTALHKDPYENLYCQIRGKKTFVLLSPLEAHRVGERRLRQGTYNADMEVVLDEDGVDGEGWIQDWPTVDPEEWEGEEAEGVVRVTLEEGDVLYLPAMWFHKVGQVEGEEGVCVAVNYWYDMEYAGPFYPVMQFVRDVGKLAKKEAERKGEERKMEAEGEK